MGPFGADRIDMGRPSVIQHHPQRVQIERALSENLGLNSVSAIYGVSVSTLRRWKERLDLTNSTTGLPVITVGNFTVRLASMADDLAAVRARAMERGDTATVVRAAGAEESVLKTLLDRLGIDSTEAADALRDAQTLYVAMARFLAAGDSQRAWEFLDALREQKASESLLADAQRLAEGITELQTTTDTEEIPE